MTRRFVAATSVERTCPCGSAFTVRATDARLLCPVCVSAAAERAAERRRVNAERVAAARAQRAAMSCDECGTRLLRAAARCGFCMPDFDLNAALLAEELTA